MRFRKVYVEITSSCNLACPFCPPTARAARFLRLDEFRRIADQVASLTSTLLFHVKGEPLLHPKFGGFLDLAGDRGLRVTLVTNGTLIDRLVPWVGHPALGQVNLSLHSLAPDSSPDQVDAYWQPLAEFVRRASAASGPMVSLRFWRQPHPDLLGHVEQEFGWRAPVEAAQRSGKGHAVAPGVWVNFDREFTWPSLQGDDRGPDGFCLGLRDQVAILVDGTVVPCCLDGEGALALGNLFTEDLATILAGPRARALVEGFGQRRCVEALCRRCGFRERFEPAGPSRAP